MGTLLHPTGSEPDAVYWRRRALVIGAALLVVILLAVALWPKGGPAAAAPAPSPSVPVTIATPVTPTSAKASPSLTPSTSPSATGPVACDPTQVKLNLAGYQKVAQTAKQTFKIAVTNPTTSTCVLTIGANTLQLTLTSGNDQIWSTAGCADRVPAATTKLKAGASWEGEVVWPMRRSTSDCQTSKDLLKTGTYVATAQVTGGPSARQVFQISQPE